MTVTTMTPSRDTRVTPLGANLIDDVRAVVARGVSPERTVELVTEALRTYVTRPGLLTDEQTAGSADHYTQHVLHAEPDGSFSVVALVWLPGQRTPVHDHVSWCVTGVRQGSEQERRYALVPQGEKSRLVVTEEVTNPRGSVCGFAPPGDIHEVRNSGSDTAISVHVYGADVTRLGSSVRRVYEHPGAARA
ncbi:cysteine dioxygenase family protein [Streptomyces sp. E5N91]|uniref:cysteine dioxygenase family protein n=1 Tax=Streptomyces sp. E5N91 TaxID=1851996 RepID=UPI000EF56759|nr:cysteine dioxygenase family protein [Streptomyces sp. E5N91]